MTITKDDVLPYVHVFDNTKLALIDVIKFHHQSIYGYCFFCNAVFDANHESSCLGFVKVRSVDVKD